MVTLYFLCENFVPHGNTMYTVHIYLPFRGTCFFRLTLCRLWVKMYSNLLTLLEISGPCHGPRCLSPAFHAASPFLILRQAMWYLWHKKWHYNPLKPKRRTLYLKPQSVPHFKHFSFRL